MGSETLAYSLIEDEKQLLAFYEVNREVPWMAFDTEFVGERRFNALLCLIQVATPNGYFIIDSLKIKDISPFLQLIADPAILKITHAGENDYRIIHNLYGIRPKNIFDTQISSGFISNTYPISFQKLVEKELGIKIKKGYTVTDWEMRPIKKNQLMYALNDVVHLNELWDILSGKLSGQKRSSWAQEETERLESEDYYLKNPDHEFMNHSLIYELLPKEQVFLYRLLRWRKSEAERKNHSLEMVLASKNLGVIVRNINEGKEALKYNRRIPDKVIDNNWEIFNELFHAKITPEERALLARIPKYFDLTMHQELVLDTLHLLVRHRCYQERIAATLVLSKTTLRKIIGDPNYVADELHSGWRRELLGEQLFEWLHSAEAVRLEMNGEQWVVSRENL